MSKGALTVDAVSKRFGTVRALDGVSARFEPREIHAVLGENGAGKSTLMGILAGFVVPDTGRLLLDGVEVVPGRPQEARRHGIAMVHQHFTLVPEFTVAENLALSSAAGRIGPGAVPQLAQRALELGQQLGWRLDPQARTGSLPVGVQQRIEILKALATDAQVLIFDEPTAVLSPDEVEDLFRVLCTLRGQGRTLILIAHKLSEVLSIADRVTVLRRGSFVASARVGEFDADQLGRWMVGEVPPAVPKRTAPAGSVVVRAEELHVRGNRGEPAVRGVSLSVSRGQILGIGGVDGNGQVELAEALAGIRPLESGAVQWESSSRNIAYIPQDRQRDGLALRMSVRDNLALAALDRKAFRKGPLLNARLIQSWTDRLVQRFEIKTATPDSPVGSLSGGNQQKVVVSRNLDETPDLLICVSPTRGLDIRATDYVQGKIREAAANGAAVVLISTDSDELMSLADPIRYLSRGELYESFVSGALIGSQA